MKINQCRFVISAVSPAQYPVDEKPEIAFAGRSNVGKSSLTNMLINRKGLAKTSSTPGKTQTINFYDIADQFRFVDLPGYGYAKVSKSQRGTWGKIIETYLNERQNLLAVVLLVDLRHKPSEDDIIMFDWIKSCGFRGIVIATKSDKIKRSQLKGYQKIVRDALNMTKDDILFCASAETRDGKYQIWDFFNQLFEEADIPIYFERQVGEPNVEKAKAIQAEGVKYREEMAQRLAEMAEAMEREDAAEGVKRPEVVKNTERRGYEAQAEAYEEADEEDVINDESEGVSTRAMISAQLRIPKGKDKKVKK